MGFRLCILSAGTCRFSPWNKWTVKPKHITKLNRSQRLLLEQSIHSGLTNFQLCDPNTKNNSNLLNAAIPMEMVLDKNGNAAVRESWLGFTILWQLGEISVCRMCGLKAIGSQPNHFGSTHLEYQCTLVKQFSLQLKGQKGHPKHHQFRLLDQLSLCQWQRDIILNQGGNLSQ